MIHDPPLTRTPSVAQATAVTTTTTSTTLNSHPSVGDSSLPSASAKVHSELSLLHWLLQAIATVLAIQARKYILIGLKELRIRRILIYFAAGELQDVEM